MSPLSEEELDAMVDNERAKNFAPLNDWSTIAARLREEGLIRDHARPARVVNTTWWMQAAAAVLIAVGGVAAGRYSANRPLDQGSVATISATETTPVQTASNTVPSAGVSDFKSADEAW